MCNSQGAITHISILELSQVKIRVNKKYIVKYKVDSFNLYITDNYVKRTIGRCIPRVENIKNH